MGTKILFFGGFGPLEDSETDDTEPDQAQFGWFNDLFSFDTGTYTPALNLQCIEESHYFNSLHKLKMS